MSSWYFETLASVFGIFYSVMYCHSYFVRIGILHQFDEHVFCADIQVLEKNRPRSQLCNGTPETSLERHWDSLINTVGSFVPLASDPPYHTINQFIFLQFLKDFLSFHSTPEWKLNSLSSFLNPLLLPSNVLVDGTTVQPTVPESWMQSQILPLPHPPSK